jgi:hypothetical protein
MKTIRILLAAAVLSLCAGVLSAADPAPAPAEKCICKDCSKGCDATCKVCCKKAADKAGSECKKDK